MRIEIEYSLTRRFVEVCFHDAAFQKVASTNCLSANEALDLADQLNKVVRELEQFASHHGKTRGAAVRC